MRLVGLDDLGIGAQEIDVDIDLGQVAHDHCGPSAFAIVQDPVEQRRFAGAEKTGKNGNGKAGIGHKGGIYYC